MSHLDNSFGNKSVDMNDWENPGVIGRNKRKAHVPLYSHRSADDAIRRHCKDGKQNNDGRIQLDGAGWRFQLYASPDLAAGQVPPFHTPEYDDKSWHEVRLHIHYTPSHHISRLAHLMSLVHGQMTSNLPPM